MKKKIVIPIWAKDLTFKKFKVVKKTYGYLKYYEETEPIKAGNVLHLKSDRYVLVGDVNKNLGVCDDCTDFGLEDIKEIATLPGF